MSRRAPLPVLFTLIALSLSGPGVASAKEVVRAEVCGAGDCAVIADQSTLRSFEDLGAPAAGPESDRAYYTVRMVTAGDGESWTFAYLPSAGLAAAPDPTLGRAHWISVNPRAAAALARATRDLEPFRRGRFSAWLESAVAAEEGFPWFIPALALTLLGLLALGRARPSPRPASERAPARAARRV
jgi:hypothetical protein